MKGMNLHPGVEGLVEEMLGDMAKELVEVQLPPEPIDIDAIALKVVALIKDDLQKLMPTRQHTRTVSLPDAESIVREAMRQAIPDYREGR